MMELAAALRWSEILLAIALLQQSAEHLAVPRAAEKAVFSLRIALAGMLLAGLANPWALLGLVALSLWLLHRFDGPYNGGSDRMGLLVLVCLTVAAWTPDPRWQEAALGYLAAQLILSYVISGQVKVTSSQWRSGAALADVFAFSAYPVSVQLRGLATRPRLLWGMSWAVMGFEIAFPLAMVSQKTLLAVLCIGAAFHLANACLFGLNRFLWVWLSAYPSLLWLQARLFGG